MKLIYVGHPYGGDPENARKVDVIIRALQKEKPDMCFISPIHAIRTPYREQTYLYDLERCLALMVKCDAVTFTGDWQKSRGCVAEYCVARARGMEFYVSYVRNKIAQSYIVERSKK